MVSIIAIIALVHLAAFAGVLLMAKYSVALVDEEGRPLTAPSAWTERVVASQEPSVLFSHDL
jgi:hypothetical protein